MQYKKRTYGKSKCQKCGRVVSKCGFARYQHNRGKYCALEQRKIYMNLDNPIYYYAWGNNPKRKTMNGRHCIIIARAHLNSIMIEFLDNKQREVVSRYSIRKVK